MEIKIGNRTIGPNHPTYFIADIAATLDTHQHGKRQINTKVNTAWLTASIPKSLTQGDGSL